MIHTIILIVLIYAAARALLRRTHATSDIRGTINLTPSPNHAAILAGAVAAAEAAHYARLSEPSPFDDMLARMITVEEPYQAKLARRELQRSKVARAGLMDYYPSHLKQEDLK